MTDTTNYSDNYKASTDLLKSLRSHNIGSNNVDYNNALTKYTDELTNIQTNRNAYFKRISSTNQYLNKTVQFTNKVFAYVTNQGYVKKLMDGTKIDAYPNLPQPSIQLNLDWDKNWTIGTIISTDPQLVVGTHMTSTTQSVGNEGDNVLYNSFIDISPTRLGCFSDTLTYVGEKPNATKDGDFTIADCRKTAIYRGKQYFGVTQYNTITEKGFCGITNTAPKSISTVNQEIILWIHNNTTKGGSLKLGYDGRLILLNSWQNEVYGSDAPSQPNYMGCFKANVNYLNQKDGSTSMQEGYTSMFGTNFMKGLKIDLGPNFMKEFSLEKPTPTPDRLTDPVPAAIEFPKRPSTRTINLPPKTKDDRCNSYAFTDNYDYYMLDGSNQCWATNSDETTIPSALNCTKGDDDIMTGHADSYAVYLQKNIANTSSNAHFYLQVEDDRVCIYRGTPTSPQGVVTILYQARTPLIAFKDWASTNNTLLPGVTLKEGESIGSPSGKLRLQLKHGSIRISTNTEESGCSLNTKTNANFKIFSTELYNLGDGVANNGTKFNTLSYIDADSKLHTYSAKDVEFDSSYSNLQSIKTSGTTNTTITTDASCNNQCDTTATCVGYSYNSNLQTCNLLNEAHVKQNMMTSDKNYYTMLKQKKPKTTRTNVGISNTVVNVDSKLYTNYSPGTSYTPDRVGWDNLDDNNSLMNQNAEQLIGKQYDVNASKVQTQYKQNNLGYNTTSVEQRRYDLIQQGIRTDNYDQIVSDSDIVTLQRNSSYLLWSILAVGTVLVSINVVR